MTKKRKTKNPRRQTSKPDFKSARSQVDGGKSQPRVKSTWLNHATSRTRGHETAEGIKDIGGEAIKWSSLPDGGMSQDKASATGEACNQPVSSLGISPIRTELLRKLLKGSPDEDFLAEGLSTGFKFHFKGTECSFEAKNSKSACNQMEAVDKKLEVEINLGRIAGPFKNAPFKNFKASPLSIREKSTPGSFRLLHNLSYPYDITSVNGGIPQTYKTVKYATIQSAVKVINSLGRGCFMAKADIKSAYRLIPVHPSQFHLLGFSWRENYYFDKFLPMGMAESCAIFEKFSDGLVYIMGKFGVHNIVKVLDDFLILETSEIDCNTSLKKFKMIMGLLGIPLVEEKTSRSATQDITFLGVRLNSKEMTAELPQDKLESYSTDVQNFLVKPIATLRGLQQIIGKLQFATSVIPIGKPFLRRLIDLTKGLKKNSSIKMTTSARTDLQMWAVFLQHYNGKSVIIKNPKVDNQKIHLLSDASDLGFAGTYGGHWIQGHWDDTWRQLNIAVRELYPILVLAKLFGHLWENHTIIFHCDNQAIVAVINKQTAKNKNIMILLRPLILQLMLHNVKFESVYIKSSDNILADSISRFQETPQLLTNYGMKPLPVPVPGHLHHSNFIRAS